MKIRGKATLNLQNKKLEVLVTLDLENGIIRCYPRYPISDIDKLMLITNEPILENFESNILHGRVSKGNLNGLLVVKFFEEDSKDLLRGRLLRELKFVEDYEPQEIIFSLKNSRLELDFQSNTELNDKSEIHFLNCWIQSDFEIDFYNCRSRVKVDKSGHGLCYFNKSLNDKEIEKFKSIYNATYCLAQGKFPILKECLTSNKLIINLSNHDLKSNPHQFITEAYIHNLFKKVKELLKNLSENELSKFNNALYYFENGLNYAVHLEIRCISLFNAFEILDNSDSLDKNMLKKHLNFKTLYDASFVIKLRNEIIHNGLSLKKAIVKIEANIRENDKDQSELLNIIKTKEYGKHVSTYFFMVNKLHQKLMDKLGYDEPVNPY